MSSCTSLVLLLMESTAGMMKSPQMFNVKRVTHLLLNNIYTKRLTFSFVCLSSQPTVCSSVMPMFGSYLEAALPLLAQHITRSFSEWLRALKMSLSVTSVIIITILISYNYPNASTQLNLRFPSYYFFCQTSSCSYVTCMKIIGFPN